MRTLITSDKVSIIMGMALSLVLTVGAAAQSMPASTDSQSQSAPSTQAPAAQNPNSSGANAQQGTAPSIDEELQLTPDQKQKIAAVVDDENKQISAVRDDNSMTLEQKQQRALEIRQAGTPKIKAILTAEQLQKLAAIQQRMREQQGTAGPQNSAPSPTPQH